MAVMRIKTEMFLRAPAGKLPPEPARGVILLLCAGLVLAALGACANRPGQAVPAAASGAGTPGPDFATVEGRVWRLAELDPGFSGRPHFSRGDLRESDAYTLSFDAGEGRASGRGNPNRFFGPFSVRDSALSMGPFGATLMASSSEPASLREHEYFAFLRGARTWKFEGHRLFITCQADGMSYETVLVFE